MSPFNSPTRANSEPPLVPSDMDWTTDESGGLDSDTNQGAISLKPMRSTAPLRSAVDYGARKGTRRRTTKLTGRPSGARNRHSPQQSAVIINSAESSMPLQSMIPAAVVQGLQDLPMFVGKELGFMVALMLRWMRRPIAAAVLFMFLSFLLAHLTASIRHTLRPLCIIPGISSSALCLPPQSFILAQDRDILKRADYSALVHIQSKTFEQLLEDSAGGSALSLEIKKAEMATADLAVRVRISNLKARDTLASVLDQLIADAGKTGRGLQKLNAKVGGAVDNIMAVNDYALRSIEEARANEPAPWSLATIAPWRPRSSLNAVVMKTFQEAMDVLSTNLQRLIVEAEENHGNLLKLEQQLVTLHEMVSREDSSISAQKSELLAELWTKVGGNKRSLNDFDSHLALLKGLSIYRKQAQVHVVAALETLRAMSADVEDMRERVSVPPREGSQVPAEVHMKSIQMGLERLKEGRIKSRRLEGIAMRRVLSMSDSGVVYLTSEKVA